MKAGAALLLGVCMKWNRSILVVEDEADIAAALCFHLEREGYVCRKAEDGERALAEAHRDPPDLIILDRMLPRVSGDEVVSRLKRDPRTAGVPILMLTAKAEDDDELVGFALGADDYVRKPFSIKVVLARVAAILRRDGEQAAPKEVVTIGLVSLDRGRHEVLVDGRAVDMTATEFRILSVLMEARSRVLSRDHLIDATLGQGAAVTNRAIDVHIAGLRKKLGVAAGYIHTVRGVGYSFRVPDDETAQR